MSMDDNALTGLDLLLLRALSEKEWLTTEVACRKIGLPDEVDVLRQRLERMERASYVARQGDQSDTAWMRTPEGRIELERRRNVAGLHLVPTEEMIRGADPALTA